MRLDRLVGERSGLSRKHAGQAIRHRRVTVDGQEVTDPAAKISPAAALALDGEPLAGALPDVALFHKPLGVHCTVGDPWGRISLDTVAAELLIGGLHPVGRLDADTDGLLLFSRDGALTQWLLHPRRAIERVYRARVDPPPTPDLAARLAAGVDTAVGTCTAEVRAIDEDTVTLAVTEGKNRMVRRLLANAGHPVLELRRLSYGAFSLGDLPPGAWRAPDEAEQAWLDRR